MKYIKITKDWFLKLLLGSMSVSPKGLVDLNKYFAVFGPINFKYKQEAGEYVAISTDFKYGTIVTSAKSLKSLDKQIKDAILTSFSVPSSYAKEANIIKQGERAMQYAIA